MREDFITTVNYSRLFEAIQNLKSLPETAPMMGLGFGRFGLGKTFGLEKIAAEENAILLRAVQTWTKSSVLTELCEELGLDTNGTSATRYKRVTESLLNDERIIIVDEVDTILRSAKNDVLEMFRDLHDETPAVVFFVGMEESNAKFKKHKHFYSRIVEFVKFQAINRSDIEAYCELSDVKIKKDLLDYFADKYPNLRQIKVILIRLEKYCLFNDIDECDFKTFKESGAGHDLKR
jgi:DNA transposition AAA+ family ATPase